MKRKFCLNPSINQYGKMNPRNRNWTWIYASSYDSLIFFYMIFSPLERYFSYNDRSIRIERSKYSSHYHWSKLNSSIIFIDFYRISCFEVEVLEKIMMSRIPLQGCFYVFFIFFCKIYPLNWGDIERIRWSKKILCELVIIWKPRWYWCSIGSDSDS